MTNKPMIGVAAVVVVAGLGTAYYLHHRGAQTAPAPAIAQSVPAAAEPPIEHPVPAAGGETASKVPLPALEDSDPPMRDALGDAIGADAVMRYLVPENIIRHLVVTIDNLPRQKVPVDRRPTVTVPGPFLADGDELHATLDPKNFARYEPLIAVLRGLDMQKTAQVYLRFYPLFQHVYQDLGYPNGYFNDRLVQVIDSLLKTPQPAGPLELTRPNVMYTFADPDLESRPAGQKLLLRMGPQNAAVVEDKLKELRVIITAAPPKR